MAEAVATPAQAAPVPATPAAAPVETPKPAATPAEDPRFAQLVAKERQIVKAQQELKAEREKLSADAREFQTWKAAREQRMRAPDKFLEQDFGADWYEKLTELRLNGNKITPEFVAASVDEKLSAFEKRQNEEREKSAVVERERIQAEQKQVIENFRAETHEFVKQKSDEYELINLHEAHNLVSGLIENHFAKTQKILSTKEAADLVETQLAEQVQKSLGTKRFAAKAASAPQADGKRPGESAQPRTLTNAHGASSTPSTEHQGPMTEEARIQRAIAAGEAARRARQGS